VEIEGRVSQIEISKMIEIIQMNPIDVEMFTFPGGEQHVTIKSGAFDNFVVVKARITSSDDIIRLALLAELMDAKRVKVRHLEMLYIPYARQDRRCSSGDSFSLKVFTNMLNAMTWDSVTVLDPHSHVATALIDNVIIRSVADLAASNAYLLDLVEQTIPVAPDIGASKKVWEIAKIGGCTHELIQAKKIRDPRTGQITDTTLEFPTDAALAGGEEVTIWDDICDGGRTFIEIAKALKAKNRSMVISLFVTHGIFSKGLQPLFDSGISHIYTTDSLPQDVPEEFNGRVTVIHV